MHFTQQQIYEVLGQVVSKPDGLGELMKVGLELLMKSERELHNEEHSDSSNGFRTRKAFGQGKILELRVPRTRHGNFYPLILTLLRDQEEESKRLAFSLYSAGLTTEQVGDLFGQIYGKSYSTSQVSRMFDYAREEVKEWLERALDEYYIAFYIDAAFIPTRRIDSVSKEAYFTVIGVRADMTREVLCIFNNPTEGSGIWEDIFMNLKSRGVKEVGIIISDALSGIENTINKHFPGTEVQLCTVHLKRECVKIVKPAHKELMAEDLKEVFATNNRKDTPELGIQRWKDFCNKWSKYYPVFKRRADNERYRLYFTYLNYDYRVRKYIYSTNWVERLNKSYKRTTKMRGALPNAEATVLLVASVAMSYKAYYRVIRMLKYETKKFRWIDEYED